VNHSNPNNSSFSALHHVIQLRSLETNLSTVFFRNCLYSCNDRCLPYFHAACCISPKRSGIRDVKFCMRLINRYAMGTWRSGVMAPTFLTSALDGSEWSSSRHGRFSARERSPGSHYVAGCIVPNACVDALEWIQISTVVNRIPAVQPISVPTELSRLPVIPVEIGIFIFIVTSTLNLTKKGTPGEFME
jgi:hypothetical protein